MGLAQAEALKLYSMHFRLGTPKRATDKTMDMKDL